jgi:hypothetical protein
LLNVPLPAEGPQAGDPIHEAFGETVYDLIDTTAGKISEGNELVDVERILTGLHEGIGVTAIGDFLSVICLRDDNA